MRIFPGKLIVAAAALAAATVALVTNSQNSATGSPDAEKAAMARLNDIQKAAEALDADKFFSYVMENNAGVEAQNGRLFLTRAEALESTRQGFDRLQKIQYHFNEQHLVLLSPTIALATGTGSSSATTGDGRTIETQFAQSVVLVLTNGEWKVFHAHRSFVPAGQ